MRSKLRHILSLVVILTVGWAGFNLTFSFTHGFKFNQVRAINVWGDWFDRTVGQRGFADIGFGRNDPRVIIANVVNILFGLLGVLAIGLIMYAGFIWMTAAGDSDKIDRAKTILRNAAIGLLIVLSSFALAVYILGRLFLATSGNLNTPGSGRGQGGSALGALGSGIIKSVYPAPGQRDVPRNTAIVITFREEMDPTSLCDQVVDGHCASDARLVAANIHVYKSDQGDQDAENLTAVKAASSDNRTFVLSPESYLGSPTEKIWYSVALTEGIKRVNGQSAFSLGGFQWEFEVSNLLDLTPPQVISGGLFPPPDNSADAIASVQPAIQAKAAVEFIRAPQVYVANSVSYVKTNNDPSTPALNITNPNANICDGQVDIVINNTTPLTANLAYRQMSGKVDTPQASIVDREIDIACGFKVKLDPGFAPGASWRLTLVKEKAADYLALGNSRYQFVDAAPKAGEIRVAASPSQLAANLEAALSGDPIVTAKAGDAKVTLMAKAAGQSGNNIGLSSSAEVGSLVITPFGGGADQNVIRQTSDRPDQPKNAVIQINFNEAVNPATLEGPSSRLADFVKIINLTDGSVVSGKFSLSNQYQTLEFQSDNQCGVNGCGDKVYCLPAGQLSVEIKAAALSATCQQDDDCAAKTPYNTCRSGLCFDEAKQAAYPVAQALTGATDLANNSLDGNRDGKAGGPVSVFKENNPNSSDGDSFGWSFWISDRLDLTPPQIMKTDAATNADGVDLTAPLKVYFDKLMMSGSLTSGSVMVDNGRKKVSHQLINLWSKANEPIGYWITKDGQDISQPPDNVADRSVALINHGLFSGSTVYRAQVGSGVKDIYQNCFKPCSGAECAANPAATSCCNGQPMSIGDNKQCP